jgi:hypothetical protein
MDKGMRVCGELCSQERIAGTVRKYMGRRKIMGKGGGVVPAKLDQRRARNGHVLEEGEKQARVGCAKSLPGNVRFLTV